MEQQIQDLIDSIRKEGLEEASKERDGIISDAKKEAERIITEAKENASKMIEDATKECELRAQSTKASLEQASRDAALSLKKEIERQLSLVLADSIRTSLDKDLVSRIVLAVVDAGLKDVSVELSGKDAQALVKGLKSELASRLKDGLELKAGAGPDGLRLVSKDGSGYVDLSAEELASALKPYLSDAVKTAVFS